METIFNQFMHVYFWVFLVMFAIVIFANHFDPELKKIKPTKKMGVSFFAVVAITLFILSFKY